MTPRTLNGQTAYAERLLDLIAPKLELVEEELRRNFQSRIATISDVGEHILGGGGKRLRPALLLLVSRMLKYDGYRDVVYAAVVEFIHTATLIHDDIIDEANVRRGRTSVNYGWGNNLTVLVGDYIFMHSMAMALAEGNLEILRLLSDATIKMIEGEILGHGAQRPDRPLRRGLLRHRRQEDRRALRRDLPHPWLLRGAPRSRRRRAADLRLQPGRLLPAHRRPARLHLQHGSPRQARAVRSEGRQGHPAPDPGCAARDARASARSSRASSTNKSFDGIDPAEILGHRRTATRRWRRPARSPATTPTAPAPRWCRSPTPPRRRRWSSRWIS